MSPAAETIDQTEPELTHRDRCDRCGAQALVRVRLRASGGGLLFCGHHWRDHEAALLPIASDVHDSRVAP